MAVAYLVCRKEVPDESHNKFLAVFADREAAAEHVRRLDAEFAPTLSPAQFNPFFQERVEDLTSLPEYALRDWLADVDIPTPERAEQPNWTAMAGLTPAEKEEALYEPRRRVWSDWWEAVMVNGDLTAEQRARVWEGLNLLSFHTLVRTTSDATAADSPRPRFAVVQTTWEYNDSWYEPYTESLGVFTTREAAERRLAKVEYTPAPGWDNDSDDDNKGNSHLQPSCTVIEFPDPDEG